MALKDVRSRDFGYLSRNFGIQVESIVRSLNNYSQLTAVSE